MVKCTCICLNKYHLTYQSPHQDHLYHSGIRGTEPSSALPCLREHTSGDYSKDKFTSKWETNKVKSIWKQVKNSQSFPRKFKYFQLFYHSNQFLICNTKLCSERVSRATRAQFYLPALRWTSNWGHNMRVSELYSALGNKCISNVILALRIQTGKTI